jgi:hypothetical protein
LTADELLLSESELIARDSQLREVALSAVPEQAARRVQVSFYDRGWRSHAIGDELRRRGIL